MKRFTCSFALIILFALFSLLAGCTSSTQATVSFSASVLDGTAPLVVEFTNTSTDANEYKWDFGDGSEPVITQDTAPLSHEYTRAGECTVTLTILENGSPTDMTESQTITVRAGQVSKINITPDNVTLNIGESQEFSIACVDSYDNEMASYQATWDIDNTIGSFSGNVFTSGTMSGTFTDGLKVTVTAGGTSLTASPSVTVKAGPLASVSVPRNDVSAGEEQQLTCVASDEYGNAIEGLSPIWSLKDDSIGSLTPGGLLRAINKAGHYANAVEVSVKQGDVEKTAAGTIEIIPSDISQLFIAPEPIVLGKGQTQQCLAVGADQYGNRITDIAVEWSTNAADSSVSADGLFTGGTTPGNYRNGITARATWNGTTITDSVNVEIEPDRIVFISNRHNTEQEQYELYSIDEDGENIEQLTFLQSESVSDADSSPDGRRIVFVTNNNMYVINANGDWMTSILEQEGLSSVSWSPDGQHIVFDIWEEDRANIYVINSDGTDMRNLTDNDAYNIQPQYSADGSKITFISTRDYAQPFSDNTEVYSMNSDGSNEQRLIEDTWPDSEPTWTPDGKSVVYSSSQYQYWCLYIVDVNTKKAGRFYYTNDRATRFADYNQDGDKIVVSVGMAGFGWSISILDNLDSEEITVTKITAYQDDNRANNLLPSWMNRKQGVVVSENAINIPDLTGAYEELTTQEVTALLKSAVVRIETENGKGSGFVIRDDGIIMTASHVVQDAREITVYMDDGSQYDGTVVADDIEHDIALVSISATNLQTIDITSNIVNTLGQQVIVLGYPLDKESVTVTSGVISSFEYDSGNNIHWVQTDSALNPGNSGGPLVNLYGQLVGMVTSKEVSVVVEGVGYAVSSQTLALYVSDLLEQID